VNRTQGRSGRALYFNGTGGSYVQFSDSSKLTMFRNVTDTSVAAWVCPTAYPSGGNLAIILQAAIGTDTFARFYFFIDSNKRLGCYFRVLDDHSSSIQAFDPSSTQIPLNVWTHVAISVDYQKKTARFYVNGQRKGEVQNLAFSIPHTPDTNCNMACIGSHYTGGGYDSQYTGYIDDLAIYNWGLDDSEIAALANGGL
ncbi:MAG TPA: LamG domain-containing protein, partial [Armatimonadota bacterium]|nr:LamG domain-containing protein [Armatimonadota bacterium]